MPGVTETTFGRWQRCSIDLGVSDVRELKQLRDDHPQLQSLVAGLLID